MRFRTHLARRLNVSAASVDADVLGEHGTSQVFMWSSARVGNVPVLDLLAPADGGRDELRRTIENEVRYANITIIEGNQASQFGIGIVAARIAEAVLRDERIVIPIGSYNSRYLTTLSMPSVVGRGGVLADSPTNNVRGRAPWLGKECRDTTKSRGGLTLHLHRSSHAVTIGAETRVKSVHGAMP